MRKMGAPRLTQLLFLSCLALLAAHCGRKTPPRPPVRSELPLVRDLEAVATEAGVTLTWSIAHSPEPLAGFNLYRTTAQLSSNDCPGCPKDYQMIRTLKAESGETRFETLDRDVGDQSPLHYLVIPFDRRNRLGPESNQATVTIKD